jgi:hypothetical protein
MSYTVAQARQQVLDVLAVAADELDSALALLAEAYEHLDEHAADVLEAELFRPMQLAYGRTKRTYGEFAARSELSSRAFESASPVAPGSGAKELIEAAVDVAGKADAALVELQDSMLPVEVGDVELRADISAVRELIGGLRGRVRALRSSRSRSRPKNDVQRRWLGFAAS